VLGLEWLADISDFVERGGDVLFVIAVVTMLMWTLIVERLWYFRTGHPREVRRIEEWWRARSDHSSWHAHQIRALLLSETHLKLTRGLWLIRTIVVLCPLFGLLGTVTGMIEVFDVMAISGSGNARAMAEGVSKATLPTMAGMMAAISGLLFSIQMDRFSQGEAQRLEDQLMTVSA
jgi:biopolymer transport protein ExbB